MFQIGDKVVCVDDSGLTPARYSELPVRGRVYVIRGFGCCPRSGLGVYLIGIQGRFCVPSDMEFAFKPHRFRKLEDLKNEARERQRKEEPTTA